MDNSISFTGNLTRDPELTFTNSGVARCVFGVASSRRYTKRDGSQGENTVFWDVICWRELAEHVVASLEKGARVTIEGEVTQRSWETDDGQKRSKMEVTATEVAASLRFATAAITRVQRNTNGVANNSNGTGQGQPEPVEDPF